MATEPFPSVQMFLAWPAVCSKCGLAVRSLDYLAAPNIMAQIDEFDRITSDLARVPACK